MPIKLLAKPAKLFWALVPVLLLCSSCNTKIPSRDRTAENKFPQVILWAWERPEDLQFLDPERFGVAFLAHFRDPLCRRSYGLAADELIESGTLSGNSQTRS